MNDNICINSIALFTTTHFCVHMYTRTRTYICVNVRMTIYMLIICMCTLMNKHTCYDNIEFEICKSYIMKLWLIKYSHTQLIKTIYMPIIRWRHLLGPRVSSVNHSYLDRESLMDVTWLNKNYLGRKSKPRKHPSAALLSQLSQKEARLWSGLEMLW